MENRILIYIRYIEVRMRILFLIVFLFGTGFIYIMMTDSDIVDAVAAASVLTGKTDKAPNLTVTSNLALKNNTIHVSENQKLIISLSSTTKPPVNIGIYQYNQYFYNQDGLNLPQGAIFGANPVDASKSVFTWTPPKGYSSQKQQESIQFFSFNPSNNRSTSQIITIIIDSNNAPVFDSNLQTSWAVDAGKSLSIPLKVLKSNSTAAVVISSSNLPKGAALSKLSKNSNGDWIGELNWTPAIGQVGLHNFTLAVKNNVANAIQSTLDLNVQVNDVLASSFISIPPVQQFASAGKNLTFKFGFTIDPHSSKPDISMNPILLKSTLSKPQKSKNIWYSTFTWKPLSTDIGKTFPVVFTIKGDASRALPASATIQIQVGN